MRVTICFVLLVGFHVHHFKGNNIDNLLLMLGMMSVIDGEDSIGQSQTYTFWM